MKHQAYSVSRFRRAICGLALGVNVVWSGLAARAMVIDDFTQGELSPLQATNYPGQSQLHTGLDSNATLGGNRLVSVGAVGYIGSTGLATVSTDPIKGRFHFSADAGQGYFKLDWGSVAPLNIDLSGGNNRFALELVDTTPNTPLNLFDLRVKSGGAWASYAIGADLASALGGNTFGVLNIPFNKFPNADFTAIQSIELDAARVPQGFHLAIESFTVVPEPTTAALLLIATGPAICMWRRGKCRPAGKD